MTGPTLPPILWWSATLAERRQHDDSFAAGVIAELGDLGVYYAAGDDGWVAIGELPADARRLVVDAAPERSGAEPGGDTAALTHGRLQDLRTTAQLGWPTLLDPATLAALLDEIDRLRAAPADRPAEPGYQRIADAIESVFDAAELEVAVWRSGQRIGPGDDEVFALARCLDKAGLIDWDAFRDDEDDRGECWLKVGFVTGERYCGQHGRAAGWPCSMPPQSTVPRAPVEALLAALDETTAGFPGKDRLVAEVRRHLDTPITGEEPTT